MGSPFDKFRQHQKRLLVFLGVICMVAFVFAGVQCGGPGMATSQPVLEVEGQTITQGELKQWLDDRRLAGAVVNLIRRETGRQFGFGQATEEEVITLMLLVRLGEELNVRISDAQINQFLSEYSQGKVSADEIRQVLKEHSATEGDLFRALRRELTAARVMLLYTPPGNTTLPGGALMAQVDQLAGGLSRMSPSMLWDIFLKLNRLARIEAIPFSVEESLGSVSTPDEKTLQEFFEQYKNDLPDPNSPTPGFRQPHRVRLQWIRIPYQKLFDEELAKVSDEEIRRYYEENKEQFPYTGLETEPPAARLPLVAPQPSGSPEENADRTPSQKASGSSSPAAEKPASQPDSGNGSSKESKKENEKQSALEFPGASPLVQQAAAVVAGPASLLALQTEPAGQENGAKEAATSPEKPKQKPPAEDPKSPRDDAPTAEGQRSPAHPAASASSAETASGQPQKEKQEDQRSLSSLVSEFDVPEDIRSGPSPKYDPLWKVEDRIRRLLAQRRVNERINQIAQELLDPLVRFSQQWVRWDASGRQGNEPPFPDLKPLLQRYGLELEQTPLVDAQELFEKYPLGKAYLGQPDPRFGWRPTMPVLQVVFQHLGLYQMEQARDAENNHYVFWKIEDRPSYVPKLEEVRDKVVRAWKIHRAREIAEEGARGVLSNLRKAGERGLQEEARTTGKPYIQPKPFSWWDPVPRGFMEYGISQVPELDNVGEEFMETVFSLEPGQLAIASNRPKTVYYVIRLSAYEYRGGQTEEQARQTFRTQMGLLVGNLPFSSQVFSLRGPYLFASQQEYVQVVQAWRNYLYDRYDVKRFAPQNQ